MEKYKKLIAKVFLINALPIITTSVTMAIPIMPLWVAYLGGLGLVCFFLTIVWSIETLKK